MKLVPQDPSQGVGRDMLRPGALKEVVFRTQQENAGYCPSQGLCLLNRIRKNFFP